MLDKFIAWLKSKNITSHTVVAAIWAFALYYDSSPSFRQKVGELFVGYPVVITKLGIITANIVAFGTMWAKYSHSSSAAGTAARAEKDKENVEAAPQLARLKELNQEQKPEVRA